ncbi:MAG: alpha-D-ribose 1-methylphosphonate 5-triphosphate diphosphatase [Burkholderiaceae bacterium]|nr:alpha-D-ribose 1-methylphosphonate 5-triphosphate diphosphatase [Burkholderiaceae bacterium]
MGAAAASESTRESSRAETVLRNLRLVLANDVIRATVQLIDGRIAAVADGGTSVRGAIDLDGDYLLPGLVELHTDNLERHMMPRPRTSFPAQPAILAHDAELVAAGITTVLDAIGVGDPYDEGFRAADQGRLLELLDSLQAHGVLRADHHVHVRCELPAPNARALFSAFEHSERVRLISLMDHTPGQRQWTNAEHARVYYTGKKGWTNARFDEELRLAPMRQAQHAQPNRRYFVDHARTRGVPLATHDDTTVSHVDEAHDEGASICEFPTTLAAARRARELGMATIAGAPNVVRGGSHSGNVAAVELARAGLLDVLSSDYVPASLIHAAWQLQRDADMSLPRSVATVSSNAAAAIGLADRGEVRPGARADLVRVREVHGHPAVRDVWTRGIRVH